MDPTVWLPTVVVIAVNLVTVAYFAGNVNARLNALQKSVDKLQGTESKIAVLEEKVQSHEEQISLGTQQFENHGRQILALARGERLPPEAPTVTSRRRGTR